MILCKNRLYGQKSVKKRSSSCIKWLLNSFVIIFMSFLDTYRKTAKILWYRTSFFFFTSIAWFSEYKPMGLFSGIYLFICLFIYLFILSFFKVDKFTKFTYTINKWLWQNFSVLIYVNCLHKYLYQLKILETENLKWNKAPKTKHTTVA